MYPKILLSLLCLVIFSISAYTQVKFTVNGQYMNRAEFRHGYSKLAVPSQDQAFFISQRARLMTSLKFENADFFVSIQDIRTWGSTSNQAIDNTGLLSVHEAWLALQVNKKLSVKMGRQEIAYDEDRIFGSLDWAMQARRHDAALLKYYDSASNTSLHVGFSYNQDKEQLAGTIYSVPNNYKTFQYLYFSRPLGKLNASFIFLNNGMQIDKAISLPADFTTVFTQTFGPRLVYKQKENKLSANASFYYQTGTNNQNRSLSAYDFIGEIAFQTTKEFSLTGGVELLSGTNDVNASANKSESFTPFYGTNHRFNGYMDYFYVNNHTNSTGLHNYYFKALYKLPKIFFAADFHIFNSAADVQDDSLPGTAASDYLGTELDLTMNYNYCNGIAIQGGYSQLFASKSMEYLKNIPDGSKQTNNWAYLSLIVRPGVAWPRTGLKL